MSGFLAMIWDPGDPAAAQAARAHLADTAGQAPAPVVLEAPGFWLSDLAAGPGCPSMLPIGESGAVYGTLFAKSASLTPAPPLAGLASKDAAAICASPAARLLSDFWGNYVAFVRMGRDMVVLADPASSIPCFHTARGRVTFVFSHLERCPPFLRQGLTINRRFILHLLAYDKIQNGETGLEGVRELSSGCGLTISPAGNAEFLAWDPRKLARAADNSSTDDAAEALRHTARYVVRSHGSAAASIALNVSGGLDSAIVAALLTEEAGHPDIEGVHFVLGGGDPSETGYARKLAAATGLRLTELSIDPRRPLPLPDQYPLTVRPYREFLGHGVLADQGALPLLSRRVTFTGQGGDHLFLETRTPLVFADYLKVCGFGRDLIDELLNAARLSGQSVWQVLRDAALSIAGVNEGNAGFISGLRDRNTRVNRLAHEQLDPADLLPVWARHAGGVPPAKFGQIVGLVHMLQIRNALPLAQSAPVLHPLISQPLIEFCLKTPTYRLCAGGAARGLARLAMQGQIPDEILRRRSKGDASRFFIEQLSANHALLAGTLLDGELVADGYVGREDLAACLAPGSFRTQTFGRMILVFYVIECWLRRWKSELGSA